ncbi:signal transduction histidine kinase [Streptomyces zagrosensis]|uniref:Signal transduction histidine kinase n=1 Tax=Streptomyces zagrosensis TaxID=1042984 RepID=A0A7W9QHU0_9ACTN|nr:signal transduction histidine kinase [Streptomyces zagrosensis]
MTMQGPGVVLLDTMSVTVTPARSATSVADVRDSTRTLLEGLVHPIPAETADTVILVVSQLLTNALRHGGGTCTL